MVALFKETLLAPWSLSDTQERKFWEVWQMDSFFVSSFASSCARHCTETMGSKAQHSVCSNMVLPVWMVVVTKGNFIHQLWSPRKEWAAICGVAQSRTWLKRLSSGSSSRTQCILNVPLCESYFKNGGTQSICRLSFLLSCICKHVKHLWFCTEISIKIPCWSFKNMRNMLSYCHPVVDCSLTPTDMFT